MPFFSMIGTSMRLAPGSRRGRGPGRIVIGPGATSRLSPVLIGFGVALHALPAASEPAVCRSLAGAAQQICNLAASIPKAADTPNPGDGDAVRVVAPLEADAFHAVPRDRIEADPKALLRQPIAVGPAQCFYFGMGDYRCVVTGAMPVVVSAPIVIPPESQASVEQGCGQVGPDSTRPCSYRIMFVPFFAGRADPNQGGAVVFRTANIMAVPSGAAASGTGKQP